MHKLDRNGANQPTCLSSYDHRTQDWDDIGAACKRDIREALKAMQGGCRCAYCEGPTYAGGHIEHFRRKAHFPELTFAWTNLFFSCDAPEHCGHHKDSKGTSYDPDDLVKPDDHNPDTLFYFHSTGEVRVRSGIDSSAVRRAEETIRVFNLNHGPLKASRRRAIDAFNRRDPDLLEAIMELPPADREAFITAEVEATRSAPFWTTIRHFFERATQ